MKIVIVGGGAAGMMAACTAAAKGAEVTLIERNSQLGIKINITGKGRCNVTNDSEPDGLIKNTLTNGRFLYSAFAALSAQDTMVFFEKIGVSKETATEDACRIEHTISDETFEALKKYAGLE